MIFSFAISNAEESNTACDLKAEIQKMVAEEIANKIINTQSLESRDLTWRTPLHNAFLNGKLLLAKALMDAGARVDAKDRCRYTPLDYAAGVKPAGKCNTPCRGLCTFHY